MIRFAALLFLIWTPAMAYDTNALVNTPLRPPTKQEQYLQSERGQEAQLLADMLKRGDRDGYNAGIPIFRQKWGIPLNDLQALKQGRQREEQGIPPKMYSDPRPDPWTAANPQGAPQ